MWRPSLSVLAEARSIPVILEDRSVGSGIPVAGQRPPAEALEAVEVDVEAWRQVRGDILPLACRRALVPVDRGFHTAGVRATGTKTSLDPLAVIDLIKMTGLTVCEVITQRRHSSWRRRADSAI